MVALTDFTVTFDMAATSTPKTASPTYTDLTSYVMAGQSVTLSRGRGSEQESSAQPGRANVALRNTDNRFTMSNGSSPYAPLQLRRPCRFRARYGGSGNLATAAQASFEDGTTGSWTTSVIGFTAPTIANSSTRAFDGTKSLLVSWPTSALSATGTFISGLVIGRQYTASAYVWVPAGSPAVRLDVLFTASGANTATAAAWTRINVTFTATAATHYVHVRATSTGAGQTAFVDALQVDEGSTVGTFTTAAPPIYPLWQGFIDDWGNRREELTGVARLSMSDRVARAAKNRMKSNLIGEILTDSPVYYLPMTDGTDARSTADVIDGSIILTPAVTGSASLSSYTFGSAFAPGPDGETALALTSPGTVTDYYSFIGTTTKTLSTTVRTLELFVNVPTATASDQGLFSTGWIALAVDSTGALTSASGTTPTVGPKIVGRGWVHIMAVVTSVPAGPSIDWQVWTNGTDGGSGSRFGTSDLGTDGQAIVGAGLNGSIGHIAVHNGDLTARIDSRLAVFTSWAGETTAARFNRLCRIAGMTSATYATSGTFEKPMAAQATAGVSLLDAVTEVAKVEGGPVYVTDTGVLTLASAGTRYNTAVGVTLDATKAGQVDPDTEIPTDDADLINDSTATVPNGTVYRTFDATSIDAYDLHDESETFYAADGTHALNWTQWRVAQFKTPAPRLTEVPVNVVGYANSGGDVAALLNAEIGTKLQITNLPADTSASSTLTLLIEGIRDEIGKDSWVRTFTTSPIGLNDSGWLLGTDTLGTGTVLSY